MWDSTVGEENSEHASISPVCAQDSSPSHKKQHVRAFDLFFEPGKDPFTLLVGIFRFFINFSNLVSENSHAENSSQTANNPQHRNNKIQRVNLMMFIESNYLIKVTGNEIHSVKDAEVHSQSWHK